MKRFFLYVILVLSWCQCLRAQQLDSLKRASLDAKLEEYVAAIEPAGPDAQMEECDFLIESCADSLVRQYVALRLYDHYFSSKIMGAESVAIHILDKWFFTGEVRMPNDVDLLNARVYADFNRNSLLGAQAPRLDVRNMAGEGVTLYDAPSKRYSVLYFYDTGCARCKIETIKLRSLLEAEEYPVDLYAFYTGDNEDAWKEYVTERFVLDAEGVNVVHLWDPEMDSDFQRKYGVLQTPKMFLIRPDGKIAGRELDTDALGQILSSLFAEVNLTYGGKEAMDLFSMMFQGSPSSPEEVRGVSDMIAQATLEKGDTLMFRQLAGDLLYYLASETGRGAKEGLAYHVDKYILNDGRVWLTTDDTLKVVGYARIVDDLLSKASPGTRIKRIKVPGVLLTRSGEKEKVKDLAKIGAKDNIIIFHTDGCNICKAEIAAAHTLVNADRRTRVFLVNMDQVLTDDPSLAARLFDSFDLSSLPYIVFTDKKGIIQSRYETLQN
ncbi:MAG: redoxin domain-containing protein [Bacteroidales bacterium]|nr:redoxin domain-containing protein [Bacteroidales bacterium]